MCFVYVDVIISKILIATVMKNSIAMISATFLRRFLLIRMLVFPYDDEVSSTVISKMMAVMASQRLMSQKDRGNCIF